MTQIREVLERDPVSWSIPNDGVAKVGPPETKEEWNIFRYELTSFVAEGEYETGLDKILGSYLTNVGGDFQPAAWVSGFFGSGKSHLLKALAALWVDVEFPDRSRASGLAKLPPDIADQFKALQRLDARYGGRFAASGTLNAGGSSAALSILSIVFAAAGLPTEYPAARLVLWLKKAGIYEKVIAYLEAQGTSLRSQLLDMYVSDALAAAVLDAKPDYAPSTSAVLDRFLANYPQVETLADETFVQVLEETIKELHSGQVPLTLLVLDELQLFLGDDPQKTWEMQQLVEAMCGKLGTKLLVVGAGQLSLRATANLQRLQDRFKVEVALRDADVNRVVQSVVLKKKPACEKEIAAVLDRARGEIARQFGGSAIQVAQSDGASLVPDYPLLPARRRLIEAVVRAIDTGGRSTKLRTQLRDVLDATKSIATLELGNAVPIDVIFDQKRDELLGGPLLPKDTNDLIDGLDDGTPEGALKARIVKAVFLLERLPRDGVAPTGVTPTGVTPTADMLIDALITDLRSDRAALDPQVRAALAELTPKTLSFANGEYRIRNKIDIEWQIEFDRYKSLLSGDTAWIVSQRGLELQSALETQLKGIKPTQGTSKVGRKFRVFFGDAQPRPQDDEVPVWVQTGWEIAEKQFTELARAAGVESETVFVFVPRAQSAELEEAMVTAEAADRTVTRKAAPTEQQGMEARASIASRRDVARGHVATIVADVLKGARVYTGGGAEVAEPIAAPSVVASVARAIDNGILRMYPDFGKADEAGWPKVVTLATQGNPTPLSAIGFNGDVQDHDVVKEVLAYLQPNGRRGQEVRKRFSGKPWGWPGDTIDGALLALIAADKVEARHNNNVVSAKGFPQGSLGSVDFRPQHVNPTIQQRLAVRALAQLFGHKGQDHGDVELAKLALSSLLDLATTAGGDAPLPPRPDVTKLRDLQTEAGNALVIAVANAKVELTAFEETWKAATDLAPQRLQAWQLLGRLLHHADGLPVHAAVEPQVAAILVGRTLLASPDPVHPLIEQLADALRVELQANVQAYEQARLAGIDGLAQDPTWKELDQVKQEEFLRLERLASAATIKVGTPAEIEKTLDDVPLHEWPIRIQAIPVQAAAALTRAAKTKQVPTVQLPHQAAVIKDTTDLDAYLQRLRDLVEAQLADGKTVIL